MPFFLTRAYGQIKEIRAWRRRQTRLSQLSNAGLKDLGIARSEIASCTRPDETRRRSSAP